ASAERALGSLQERSRADRDRLRRVYGGRLNLIIELMRGASGPGSGSQHQDLLAAEVVFAIRHELARTLIDIQHRRTMTGLAPDLGASVARDIAKVAAAEFGWDDAETARQLQELDDYNARLKTLRE
ncbi:MAG: glycerol-3-phosphate dehydrogenase C-terminal domain-containing protein, partial [Woeseiaceae bacterium]